MVTEGTHEKGFFLGMEKGEKKGGGKKKKTGRPLVGRGGLRVGGDRKNGTKSPH